MICNTTFFWLDTKQLSHYNLKFIDLDKTQLDTWDRIWSFFFGRSWKKLINLISTSRMLILCCGSYVATFSMIRVVTHSAHSASIFQDNIIKSSSLEIYQMETGDNRKSVKTFPTFVYVYSVDWRWRWRWRLYWVLGSVTQSIKYSYVNNSQKCV